MKIAPLLALALGACALPNPMSDTERLSLAAAESAFAAHSVREDMRVAFLANFADDGVFVRNGWLVSNTYLAAQKAPPIVLDWKPVYTEIAPSGELGLSTGPWKITSKEKPDAPATYGQFVSVWRREAGRWKVAVDLGIGHPQSAFWDAPLEAVALREAGGATGGVAQAEAKFAADARALGLATAYRQNGADNLRFYRNGTAPAVGLAAALASPALHEEILEWKIERSETARSGDWGYSRGNYAAPGAAKPAGWFMHVWRFERGAWRLVLDVTNPAPPAT